MSIAEKRKSFRAIVNFPVVAVVNFGREVNVQAVNISVSGICIQSKQELPFNARLVLRLPVECGTGVVVATVVRREDCNYGCKFQDLSPKTYEALDEFVRKSFEEFANEASTMSYTSGDLSFSGFGIAGLLGIIAYIVARIVDWGHYGGHWAIISDVACALCFFILLRTSRNQSGWQIIGNRMLFRVGECNDTIDLSTAKIDFVDFESEWEPLFYKTEFGVRPLTDENIYGYCVLKNNEEAFVFRHNSASEAIILNANFNYYLISHPGIENLYKLLEKRGVQKLGKNTLIGFSANREPKTTQQNR